MLHRVVTGLTEITCAKHLAWCLSYSRLLINISSYCHWKYRWNTSYIIYFLFLETHISRREYQKKKNYQEQQGGEYLFFWLRFYVKNNMILVFFYQPICCSPKLREIGLSDHVIIWFFSTWLEVVIAVVLFTLVWIKVLRLLESRR